jgi:hypothetical protein
VCGLVAFLQVWHFWRPIDACAFGIAAGLGGVGLIVSRGGLRAWAGLAWRTPGARAALTAWAAVVVWCANRAIGPGDAFDSGLYHYQAIHWDNAFALVPGLGNVHYRLAYNNASLLFQAMLNADGTPWHGRANHVGNGALLVGLYALIVSGASRLVRVSRPRAHDVYATVLVIPAVMLTLSKEVSSPRTDLPAAVLCWFIGWQMLVVAGGADRADRRLGVLCVMMTAGAAVCMKLSCAPLALTAWVVAAASWLWAERAAGTGAVRTVVTGGLLSLALVGPWLVRGYVLSGYPLFPLTMLSSRADWRVPPGVAQNAAADIRDFSWSGLPDFAESTTAGQVPAAFAAHLQRDDTHPAVWGRWLASLVVTGPIEIVVPAALGVLALGIIVARRRNRRRTGWWWALAPPLVGAAAWVAMSPNPRFGYASLWSAAAVACAGAWPGNGVRRARIALAVVCTSAVVAACGYRMLVNLYVYDVPFYGPGADEGFHPLPPPALVRFTTATGLNLFEPAGPPPGNWSGELLFTPDRASARGLALRDPTGGPARGFRIGFVR